MKTSLSIHASKKSSVSVGLNSLGNFCWIQLSSSSSSQPLISSIVGSYAVDFSPSTGELGSFFLEIGLKKALMEMMGWWAHLPWIPLERLVRSS